MLDRDHFRDQIVTPACERLGLVSPEAIELVVGTAIQESRLTYLTQLGAGSALGLFQIEPATHDDVWKNVVRNRARYKAALGARDVERFVYDLRYSAMIARLLYWRHPEPIPTDLEGQAHYWKRYYNTALGAGTPSEYIANNSQF